MLLWRTMDSYLVTTNTGKQDELKKDHLILKALYWGYRKSYVPGQGVTRTSTVVVQSMRSRPGLVRTQFAYCHRISQSLQLMQCVFSPVSDARFQLLCDGQMDG